MAIEAADSQFSVATGGNVNTSGGSSAFDGPPSDTTGLNVTPNAGDPSPYQFTPGETYDLEYTDPSGKTVTLEDAGVLRSDTYSGGVNVVVFEGEDQDGNTVQVCWAPDYDLQGWYDQAEDRGTPRFYTADQLGTTYGHVCLAARTLIETPRGAVQIADLRRGDRVVTLDGPSEPVTWIGRRQVAGIGPAAPIRFAPGAIGNHRPLRLSGQHRVLLVHPLADLLYDSSEVLVPAKSLINGDTIRCEPCPQVTWMNLATSSHALIRAEGAAVETLWLGEVARNVLGEAGQIAANYPDLSGAGRPDQLSVRPMLRHREALELLSLIHGRDLRPARQLSLL
ncbi:Hint domain-containing protein [Aliiroseovarius sp.]|uniref:Hint domain-containing protein n=1 Tax=Aliiroseovarius sp. TaxID=1872442 RepID=UPI002638C7B9|nr:Hint domain-containing protein [Aliiroseovarius sp.]